MAEWLIAETGWAGPGQWLGPCALPLSSGVQTGAGPIRLTGLTDVLNQGLVHRVPGTLLPGLADAHIHSGLIDLAQLRAGGISAAVDLAGVPAELTRLGRLSRDPAAGLPRLDFAGLFLTTPGGYPSRQSWARGYFREVRSAVDAETAVGEQIEAGAVCIKVALNSDVGPVFPDGVLAAVVAAAHRPGLPVVAHVQGPGLLESALAAGVDRLAHTPWTDVLDPHLLRTAAEQQSVWISTLAIHQGDHRARAIAVHNLRGFAEHGGEVRYGTDLGNGPLPVGINADEIRALQEIGLMVDDVLLAMAAGAASGGGPYAAGVAPAWVPGGLDRDPAGFAASLTTARVFSARDQEGPA